jgi:GT2 family glycosyltransferase/tetratricopeptide (TPR) repeat protein
MQPQVSIIIPVRDRLDLTRQCLASIQANTPHDLIEVIIVDNGSTDGTADFLKNWKGPFDLKVIQNPVNQGYATANNQGVANAGGDLILLLKNDTEPQENWLTALMDIFHRYPHTGAAGAKMLFPDGTVQHAGVLTAVDKINEHAICPFHIAYKMPDNYKLSHILKVPAVTGACMMVPAQLYRELGGMDESYWNGYEDVDLCFKILEAGFDVYFQPQSVVIHHESQSGPQRHICDNQNIALLNSKWQDTITCQFVRKTPSNLEPNNDVTITIVTYNSAATIVACIKSLQRTLRCNDEVIIVDNASRDDTANLVLSQISHDSRFKFISNPANIGYAAAASQGAKAGCKPYIVFLNPDTLVADHWIEHLQYHLIPHKVAAVGPVSNFVAGLQKAGLYLPGELRDHNDLNALNRMLRQKYHRQALETKLLIGFCLMIKRKVYERIGGMDEMFFLGNDDLDLSWRISKAGYRIVVAKDCMVFHQGQVSFASEAKEDTRRLVQESTDYLFYKLTRHYGPDKVPSSQQLWGIDWFRPGCRFSVNQPLTSIIMLTFNQVAYTKQCIESVFTHTKAPFELIIVDNGSTDSTLEYIYSLDRLKSSCLRIKVISNTENMGFAKGCNQGLEVARGEFLLLLNNDVVVTSGWLSRLLRVADDRTQIQMVGPMTNYVSGPQFVENPAYDVVTADGLQQYAAAHACKHDAEIRTNWRLVGFCMLIKRCVIEKIGGLDDHFRIGNFEDDDFCLRARLAGFHAAIARDCYVHHYGSQTFLGNQIDYDKRSHSNWKLFKEKWNIPDHASHQIPLPKGGFDKSKHYFAIGTDALEYSPKSALRPQRTNPTHQSPGLNRKPSNNVQLKPSQLKTLPGGIQMSILDHVFEAVKKNVAPQNKPAAIWILQRIIEADSYHAMAHNELGLLFFEQKELAKAQSHLHQAVRYCTDNPEYFINLGDFYHVVHRDGQKAIQMYTKAAELNAIDEAVLLKIAHLHTSERELQEAMHYYQRVLEINPNQTDARQCLDQINQKFIHNGDIPSVDQIYARVQDHIQMGDRESAIDGLRRILSQESENALVHNDLGVLLYEQNKIEEALEHYRQAVTLEPDNTVFLKNLADFQWNEHGDPKAAMELYVRVLKITPDDMEAILNYGRMCMAINKDEDARFFFERLIEKEPGNETFQALIRKLDQKRDDITGGGSRDTLYEKAQKKAAAGDLIGAIEDLTQLVFAFKNDADAFNDLGVLYLEAGNNEKALGCYREAVRLAPDNEIFQKNLADYYLMRQGRIEDAMKIYLNVLEKNPLDVDSLLASGLVCLHINRSSDARKFFERVIEIEPWNHHAQEGLDQIDRALKGIFEDQRKNSAGFEVCQKVCG